jgi:hypothetical protein
MQHKKTVGAANIMCMVRRAARRIASCTASAVEESGAQAALEGVAVSGTTPNAQRAKKRRRRYIVDSGSSFKDVYADKAIHECNVHMNTVLMLRIL